MNEYRVGFAADDSEVAAFTPNGGKVLACIVTGPLDLIRQREIIQAAIDLLAQCLNADVTSVTPDEPKPEEKPS